MSSHNIHIWFDRCLVSVCRPNILSWIIVYPTLIRLLRLIHHSFYRVSYPVSMYLLLGSHGAYIFKRVDKICRSRLLCYQILNSILFYAGSNMIGHLSSRRHLWFPIFVSFYTLRVLLINHRLLLSSSWLDLERFIIWINILYVVKKVIVHL